ncbi:MAG: hypothetical protein JXB30_02460 [Anaerolineae bacterium]|nr:hypothetical protein [Anaerolineae bacterium]
MRTPQDYSLTATPTNTPMDYELTSGEAIHRLPDKGEGFLYDDLSIGIGGAWTEPFVDETGLVTQRWTAKMAVWNHQCYPTHGRTVSIGDIIDFAGYRIRILDFMEDHVIVAISGKSLDPVRAATECVSSIYNRLPDEQRFTLYRESGEIGDLVFVKSGDTWIEEYVDANGETVEGSAIELSITSSQSSDVWEGVVHIGDIIEYEEYQIRIQVINEEFIDLVFGNLAELHPVLGEDDTDK